MKKTIIVVAVVLNIALVVAGSGELNFLVNCLIIAGCLFIGLPLLILSAALFSASGRKPEGALRRFSIWGFVGAFLIFSTCVSLPASGLVLDQRISRVKTYCETLVPKLEDWKDEHGAYPANISALTSSERHPGLFEPRFYHTNGKTFWFVFTDPGGLMNGFEYSSLDRNWHEWD